MAGAPVNPSVVLSSTFHQGGPHAYGRDGNPTWEALEEVLGALEGGQALVFSSGMAAIAAVLESLPVPGRVVVGDAYSGTRRFLADVADRGRLGFLRTDLADTAAALRACAEVAGVAYGGGASGDAVAGFGAHGLLWLESPTNPLLAIADLSALAEGAHRLGMDVVVDNTFATPLAQRPLDLGADVVVHSGTKWLAGHSDVIIGVAVSRRVDLFAALAARRSLHGAIAGPWESWLTLRGVRTLAVRLERAQSNAGELAVRLAGHPRVKRVLYPGLPDHPGHALARRQMTGFGAMLAFEVSGGEPAAESFVSAVRLATAGTSLGGVETLLERRARWAGEEHLPAGLVRVSVGIEDVEDLWRDLDRALSRL
ncbi:MAG: trans-sulfuration enzyme family protein [Acidimicrobiales bacterium]